MTEPILENKIQEETYEFQYSPESAAELSSIFRKRSFYRVLPALIVDLILLIAIILFPMIFLNYIAAGTCFIAHGIVVYQAFRVNIGAATKNRTFHYTITPEKILMANWDSDGNENKYTILCTNVVHYLDTKNWYILYTDQDKVLLLKKSMLIPNSSLPAFLKGTNLSVKKAETFFKIQKTTSHLVLSALLLFSVSANVAPLLSGFANPVLCFSVFVLTFLVILFHLIITIVGACSKCLPPQEIFFAVVLFVLHLSSAYIFLSDLFFQLINMIFTLGL